MPACTMSPIQDRSSADSARNHGMSRSMRATVDVVSAPTDRCSRPGDGLPVLHRVRARARPLMRASLVAPATGRSAVPRFTGVQA